MSSFNLENYLTEISSDSPCGQNLEDDFAFARLENDAKFVGERQMGNEVIPEVEPDWKQVRASALELLARSRDIQVAMHLCCALLKLDGLPGLIQGLALIRGLLEKYWDDVHPRQDPDDDYPVLRINTLSRLKDDKKILDPLKRVKLTKSKAGNFSWREIEIAQGNLTTAVKGEDIPDLALIDAAFIETPFDYLKQQEALIKQTLQLAQGIMTLVADKAGSVNTPDILPLVNLLKTMGKSLAERIQQRPEAQEHGGEQAAGDASGEPGRSKAPGGGGAIQSRADVIRSIDAICKYFERYEPSSPVPFLLLRAKKMLTMNFMDILQEMAPDAVKHVETICGVEKKK